MKECGSNLFVAGHDPSTDFPLLTANILHNSFGYNPVIKMACVLPSSCCFIIPFLSLSEYLKHAQGLVGLGGPVAIGYLPSIKCKGVPLFLGPGILLIILMRWLRPFSILQSLPILSPF